MNSKVALITGGASGIGKATALLLARQGVKVVISGRREALGQTVVRDIKAEGFEAAFVIGDVNSEASVHQQIEFAVNKYGRLDLAVNNAGIAISGVREEDFDLGIAVNLKSAFLCSEAVLPGMRARRWGRIVNISSGAARGPGLLGVVYNASKAGLEGLTRGYASRVAKDGVTANAIAPGPTDTEMGAPLKAGGVEARIPVGRMGQAEEVAQATVMVIGNGFITGQTIAVNGGLAFL